MSVERFEQQDQTGSPTDRLLSFARGFVANQPLTAGVAAGLLVGALTNSGLAFFVATAIVTALGLHMAASANA